MEEIALNVKKREFGGTGVSRKIRKLGWIPSVLYGGGEPNLSLIVPYAEIKKILKKSEGKNPVIKLNFDDNSFISAILKDFQLHPIKRTILHCDFLRITPDRKVKVTVPIVLKGKSEGEAKGGFLYQQIKEVAVFCKPSEIPSEIEVDITFLKTGQTLFLSDLQIPEGVKILYRKDAPVATIKAEKLEAAAPSVSKAKMEEKAEREKEKKQKES